MLGRARRGKAELIALRGNDPGDRRPPRLLPGCQLRGELGVADDVEPELRPEQGQLPPFGRTANRTGLEELEHGSGRGHLPLQCLGQGAELNVEVRVEDGEEQVLPAGKVRVERPPREPGPLCDLLDGGTVEAALGEHLARRLDEPGPGGGAALPPREPLAHVTGIYLLSSPDHILSQNIS